MISLDWLQSSYCDNSSSSSFSSWRTEKLSAGEENTASSRGVDVTDLMDFMDFMDFTDEREESFCERGERSPSRWAGFIALQSQYLHRLIMILS